MIECYENNANKTFNDTSECVSGTMKLFTTLFLRKPFYPGDCLGG